MQSIAIAAASERESINGVGHEAFLIDDCRSRQLVLLFIVLVLDALYTSIQKPTTGGNILCFHPIENLFVFLKEEPVISASVLMITFLCI